MHFNNKQCHNKSSYLEVGLHKSDLLPISRQTKKTEEKGLVRWDQMWVHYNGEDKQNLAIRKSAHSTYSKTLMHFCKQINQLNRAADITGYKTDTFASTCASLCVSDTHYGGRCISNLTPMQSHAGGISDAGRDAGCSVWPLLRGWDLIINEHSATLPLPCRPAPVLSAACQSLLGQPEPREQRGMGPKTKGDEWVSITVSSPQGR